MNIQLDPNTLLRFGGLAVAVVVLVVRFQRFVLVFKRFRRAWRARGLVKVWGIRNGDRIRVVCSELPLEYSSGDDAGILTRLQRQYPEERQFIYLNKYGDVDALFEVVTTLIVLYPDSEIVVMSAREQATIPRSGDCHIVLIGGPDYNPITASEIDSGRACVRYLPPSDEAARVGCHSMLHDAGRGKLYFIGRHQMYPEIDEDWGYLERYPVWSRGKIASRYNVVILGGANTVGVTGIARAFAAFRADGSGTADAVLVNAGEVAERLGWLRRWGVRRSRRLVVFCRVRKEQASIAIPLLDRDEVFVE